MHKYMYSSLGDEAVSNVDSLLRFDFVTCSERRWQAQVFWVNVIMVIVLNCFIIQYGDSFDLHLSKLNLNEYLWTNLIAVMVIPWFYLSKRVLKLIYPEEEIKKMHLSEEVEVCDKKEDH